MIIIDEPTPTERSPLKSPGSNPNTILSPVVRSADSDASQLPPPYAPSQSTNTSSSPTSSSSTFASSSYPVTSSSTSEDGYRTITIRVPKSPIDFLSTSPDYTQRTLRRFASALVVSLFIAFLFSVLVSTFQVMLIVGRKGNHPGSWLTSSPDNSTSRSSPERNLPILYPPAIPVSLPCLEGALEQSTG
ncbi:hypothetical protein BDQ12DRAFT_48118 [Crucibulum laeve]|uniref:Uncharacterized protein n=1 Tax=Crucibulum laeve TaxID=68775 RepID=A0A5C3MUM5_9AGAR|nr:hypothetical protein BDQ12DRAFT_48118 [Crucibulum laeve]